MHWPAAIFLICLAVFPAAAGNHESIYGTWGTAQQCAGKPIKPGGTVLAAPYTISAEWLRQGQVWCQLNWFPIEHRATGVFTGAHAKCGEDAIRDYFLGMELSGSKLTLRWDVFRSNGPLSRCDTP